MKAKAQFAYFSMEIALHPDIPTYSGGLGVLAGDTIRTAADFGVPVVVVTLLHRKGYFCQCLDAHGNQREEPVAWEIEQHLQETPVRASVALEEKDVLIRAWSYEVKGIKGGAVTVYLLDTDLPENDSEHRHFTDYLYGGDNHYRLCQETILGIGGVRILRALGYDHISRFHMNEGHASLLAVELLNERLQKTGRTSPRPEDVEFVRNCCVFTTHTPVPAGSDKFPKDLVERVVGQQEVSCVDGELYRAGILNMTFLGIHFSRYINGVAKKHGEVSRQIHDNHSIDFITNGIHVATWVCPSFQRLFDRHIPGWREDSFSLRYALGIPTEELWDAHLEAKYCLFQHIEKTTQVELDSQVLTLGFARRMTAYKRPDLFFRDIDRLKQISRFHGRLQLVYAGKAHPQDHRGKDLIRSIFQAQEALAGFIKVVFLEDYDVRIGQLITSGVDIWLNTPQPPLEASGTSGMKAAVNGVPSLSTLDGWWVEGCIEGVTGWGIGTDTHLAADRQMDADVLQLYEKLETVVIPTFYHRQEKFLDIMRHSIALNGSFFNTQRMIQEYLVKAYYAN